ncbi:hypothetical protein [Lentzea flaviverrucosa]|uniref:Uncharacterized protein n=1 Tax=Lentzea flaviverrucosa TaxID=200379 RepID=A0A1H9RPI8_9PSEU|nr:hypothetical protein [Lentzea flaviverrucosa]RDI33095.1 hypothetical protein DFR72_102344 [Lentzea flaviverrucosa]SER74682.1 hypothetical protein SAMN05216195_106345 [Lentzea flaviverrucosa]
MEWANSKVLAFRLVKQLTVALALVMALIPALVPLLPDWGGVIYGSPAVSLQTFQA